MRKKENLAAFLIIGILGTLWHFVYAWSGENRLIGLIAPVNESVWEHLKLLFYPTLFYSAAEFLLQKSRPKNQIPAVIYALLAGMLSIVVLFYTYTGILGYSISVIDISLFFIGLLLMLWIKKLILKNGLFSSPFSRAVSLGITILLIFLFGLWSFNPPPLGLFTPPVS